MYFGAAGAAGTAGVGVDCVGGLGVIVGGITISTGATGAGGATTGVPTGAVAPGGIGVIVVGPVGPVSVIGWAAVQ